MLITGHKLVGYSFEISLSYLAANSIQLGKCAEFKL